MKRLAWIVSAGLVAAVLLTANVGSRTPTPYAPVPQTAFAPVHVDTLWWPTGGGNGPRRVYPVETAPAATPRPTARPGASVAGIASWYVYHPGQAAAAAMLRRWLGQAWRGTSVTVCGPLSCRRLILTDYESSLRPGRLIDVDPADFLALCGPVSLGLCRVTVSR